VLKRSEPAPAAVVLIRDRDNQEQRRRGLEQARNLGGWPFPIVIGLARPEREAWVIAGFEPRDAAEEARLQELARRLSFHPVREAHRLSSGERDAKSALKSLTAGELAREHACLNETPLEVLRARGKETGLTDYLDEVRERLVPALGGGQHAEPQR
jgi:hypothetical protein